MVKRILLLLCLLFQICMLNAQQSSGAVIEKFIQFYGQKNADSIYHQFGPKMKQAIDLKGTQGLMIELYETFGNFKSVQDSSLKSDGLKYYRLVFDKSTYNMAIYVQNEQIVGINTIAAKPVVDEALSKESPDNFSLSSTKGTIYGTLKLPDIQGAMPVVLMIAGSGPTDRNMNQGTVLRTNSFSMLADFLASKGIASLRYDKRGVGKSISSQKASELIFEDFVSDGINITEMLKKDGRFSKVYVLGHSEGALIATLIAAQTGTAGLISISGPASNIAELLAVQLKNVLDQADYKIARAVLDSLQLGKTVNTPLPQSIMPVFRSSVQPFLISLIKYDPLVEMSKVKMPVLVIGGTSDLQVGVENADRLSKANAKSKLSIINDMNHVLKNSSLNRAENISTYSNPSLPINANLLEAIFTFLKTTN